MDRANDVVYIDLVGTIEPMHIFLTWLARFKGLRTEVIETAADRSPAIVFQGIQIEGFWPCVDFLLDTRPYPDILPDTPGKRAVIRSLTERVLSNAACLGEIATYYNSYRGTALPPQSTLLDLAVAAQASSPAAHRYPWAITIAELVDRRINAHRDHERYEDPCVA